MTDGFNDKKNKMVDLVHQLKDVEDDVDQEKAPGIYEALGVDIGRLVDIKNKAYGDSFHRAGDFLKILYPDGIEPNQYIDVLCIVRIFDKLMRIATDKDALGESPYRDIGGYALLGLEHSDRCKKED